MKSSDNPEKSNSQDKSLEEIFGFAIPPRSTTAAAEIIETNNEAKAKFKEFCNKQLDFSELDEIFPDRTIKAINISLYRGPKYYPSHGIPPDEVISVITVEFNDGSSVRAKTAKSVKPKNMASHSNNNTTTCTK